MTTQQFTIRRLEVGEKIQPGDIFVTPLKTIGMRMCGEDTVTAEHRATYRISLKNPPAEAKEGEVQIVEGCYYKNRKGEKVGPMIRSTSLNYPWACGIETYRDNGMAYKEPCPIDIISEWPDPHQDPAPQCDVVRHEVEELRKANAALLRVSKQRKEEADSLLKERDQLAAKVVELETQAHMRSSRNDWLTEKCNELTAELAKAKDYPDADGTDFAHPAWWRGHDHTTAVFCQKVNEILDGKDDARGVASEPWESTRRRLLKLAKPKQPEPEEWITPTDEDAKQRPECEVRDHTHHNWESFHKLIAVRDGSHPFITVSNSNVLTRFCYCRVRKGGSV